MVREPATAAWIRTTAAALQRSLNLKYPQSSPLTEMYEQGTSPWPKSNKTACSTRFAEDLTSELALALALASASKLGEQAAAVLIIYKMSNRDLRHPVGG
jgi:hypothetical protein